MTKTSDGKTDEPRTASEVSLARTTSDHGLVSSNPPPGLGKRALFVVIILAVTLLLCELGWRTYLYSRGRGFLDNPNEFISPFFTTYEEPPPFIRPEGFWFRNGAVTAEKPSNEIRVICFGGSTTVNWRAGISYTDILERKLAETSDGVVVRFLNAGGDGYSTAHTLVNLALRNLDVKPDVITVYHNINDLSAVWFGDGIQPDYANKYKTDFYLGFRHRTGLVAAVTKISRLARRLLSSTAALKFPQDAEYRDRPYDKGLIYFVRNLRSIIAIAKAHGVPVALATQAARSDFRVHPGFHAYNQAIRDVAEREAVLVIDLEKTVTEDRLFFNDAIHNTREGVEAVAEQFYAQLATVIVQIKKTRMVKPQALLPS